MVSSEPFYALRSTLYAPEQLDLLDDTREGRLCAHPAPPLDAATVAALAARGARYLGAYAAWEGYAGQPPGGAVHCLEARWTSAGDVLVLEKTAAGVAALLATDWRSYANPDRPGPD
jgi:hypothetical protein